MEGLKLVIYDQITGYCPSCPSPDLHFIYESGGGKGESYDEVRYKIFCAHERVCKYRDRAKNAKVVE